MVVIGIAVIVALQTDLSKINFLQIALVLTSLVIEAFAPGRLFAGASALINRSIGYRAIVAGNV